mgnify:CR=1 FL=1
MIPLAVERSRVDGYELLTVEGELDIATAPRMIAALNEAYVSEYGVNMCITDSYRTLSSRYWSEATKERSDPSGVFYYYNAERPRQPGAPEFEGTGEIRLETTDRGAGYWLTRSPTTPELNIRTSGVYLREIFVSPEFAESKGKLPLALGAGGGAVRARRAPRAPRRPRCPRPPRRRVGP